MKEKEEEKLRERKEKYTFLNNREETVYFKIYAIHVDLTD